VSSGDLIDEARVIAEGDREGDGLINLRRKLTEEGPQLGEELAVVVAVESH
jgi:hypothetical protein